MNSFWSAWVSLLTVVCVALVTWLLFANRKSPQLRDDNTTGHEFDGIVEQDNPLPAWWFNLFVATIVFGAFYLLLYPGLGNYRGLLNWTSESQYDVRAEAMDEAFKVHMAGFSSLDFEQLVANDEAMRSGKRLFSTHCALCHGSNGQGATGFPRLTDDDWLYGKQEADLIHTIAKGRVANMPAWQGVLGEEGVEAVSEYVIAMSQTAPADREQLPGHALYQANCMACHGAEGDGNTALGAPRLNDDTWLYGGDLASVRQTLIEGRAGVMPAHDQLLGEEKIRLLAAYVKRLATQP